MKIKIIIIIHLIIISNIVKSQNNFIPEEKYKEGNVFKNVFKAARISTKGLMVSYGYLQTQFMNSRYAEFTSENIIKQVYGHTLSFRQPIYPVFIDFNIFQSLYETKLSLTEKNSKLSFRGLDFSLSLALFPVSGRVATILMPYVGAGYQFAKIVESKSYFTMFSDTNIYSVLKVKQSFWKVGLMIKPVQRLLLTFEYRQSMQLTKENALNQFSITIGYRFKKDFYLIRLFTKKY